MTRAKWIALLLVAIAVIFIGAARIGLLEADYEEALLRYGSPPSQFMEIDGTRVHYRDEGEGRTLVLLHGSRGNLQQWDGWVAALGAEFRIIRVDALGHGLSGPDGPDDYSAERGIFLLRELLASLRVEQFILGGTSGGATQAVRYAAMYPQQVEALLLSTVPLRLPSTSQTRPLDRMTFWIHDEVLGTKGTNLYWSAFLRSIYGDPGKVTEDLIQRYRTLNTLPGQEQRFRKRIDVWYAGGGPERDYATAGKVVAPTFIQWGASGPVLPAELFCEIAAAFSSTSPRMIQYSDLGHKLVMEDPVRTARDALAFVRTGAAGEACDESANALRQSIG